MTMTKPTSEQITFTAAGAGATLRNLVDKVRECVSVKDFGAVGDGVADDTAAIQAAMTAHKKVYFPAGSYKITSSLVLTTGAVLIGDGMDRTYIKPHTIGMVAIRSNSVALYVQMSDLAIEPTTITGFGGVGLLLDSVSQSAFYNIRINGFRTGALTGIGMKLTNTYGGSYFNSFEHLAIENSDTALLMEGTDPLTAVGYHDFLKLVIFQEHHCLMLKAPVTNSSIYNHFNSVYIQGDGGPGYGVYCEGGANLIDFLVIDQGAGMTKNVSFNPTGASTASGNSIVRAYGVTMYENNNVSGAPNQLTNESAFQFRTASNYDNSTMTVVSDSVSELRTFANNANGTTRMLFGNGTAVYAWAIDVEGTSPSLIFAKNNNNVAGNWAAIDYESATFRIGNNNATTSGVVAGAKNGIHFAAAGAPPTGNTPYLYVDSGALKYKGASGTITTIAPT